MLISVAIVTGFQSEITRKVTGFDAHLKVVSLLDGSDQYNKLVIDHDLLEKLKRIRGVNRVQIFAQQPGILEFSKEIQGVAIKGVDSTFNREFFKSYLKQGKIPDFKKEDSHEILLSSQICDKLRIKLGQKIRVYFVSRNKPVSPRNFTVAGIYKTGLPTFDSRMVFISLPELQKVKNYGLRVYLSSEEINGKVMVKPSVFGGDKQYTYHWSNGWQGGGVHELNPPAENKIIRLVVKDGANTVADTAWFNTEKLTGWSSGGSDQRYADGYEIFIDDFRKLKSIDDQVYEMAGYNLTTTNVKEENPEIFNWLDILDVNVYIIIILLGVVAIINMCSALLILILERANMIGILKAIGANDYSIRKIFLYNGVLLIGRGLLWGNVIAIVLLAIQHFTGIITLPEEQYYVHEVPVNFNILHFLTLNAATVVVSMIVLILPSMLISKLSPAKTIRFE